MLYKNTKHIIDWLKKHKVKKYTINEDLSVDVDGDVSLSYKNLTEPPVKFGIVKGNFSCANNQLTSTNFLPKEVYGNLNCYRNNFKNLDNFPKVITNWMSIRENPNLENIIGLWNCDFRGNEIRCNEKWKEEIECYLIFINRLKEVKIYSVGFVEDLWI